MPPRLLVSLCTYNERDNLAPLIAEIHRHAPGADVLVVDDNSPDGTGRVADELAADDPRVKPMHRPGKLGLGTALMAAVDYAASHDYDYLLNLDADFSHPPRFIPPLVECMERVDVAIGSRYVAGGEIANWGLGRRVMSWLINRYARWRLRLPVRDTSGSFRCYRVAKLREIDFSQMQAHGYVVLQELLYRCRRADCTMEEVPIRFEDRRYGESKINWREAAAALQVMWQLGREERRAGLPGDQ